MSKKLIKYLVQKNKFLLRKFLSLFYDEKYLRGKYFDDRLIGWKWAIEGLFFQKLLGFNRHVPWPCSIFIRINNPKNLVFHVDDLNNFQSYGIYFQNSFGKIYIGKGTYIAPNVGFITANHDFFDLDKHTEGKDIIVGENCWIGMNAVILPGVKLGKRTIVGAGSIVTKSFPEGNCVIAGNPARIIKFLDKNTQNSRVAS